jgi:hypothetical protein
MQIETGLVVVAASLGGSGFLGWAAYVTKQLVEHARLLAIITDRQDRGLVFAARSEHLPD